MCDSDETFYVSKIGEVNSKADWMTWAVAFYEDLQRPFPPNAWEKIKKIFGLTKVPNSDFNKNY